MSSRPRSRILKIAASVLLLAVAAFVSWYWWRTPGWDFPVERVSLTDNGPAFSSGGLIAEERVSIAYEVRRQTWRPVARVIVDDRDEQDTKAYAFVGNSQGSVYTLRSAGLDSWELATEGSWAGDPHAHVLAKAMPASVAQRTNNVRSHAPCEVGGRASFVRRAQ